MPTLQQKINSYNGLLHYNLPTKSDIMTNNYGVVANSYPARELDLDFSGVFTDKFATTEIQAMKNILRLALEHEKQKEQTVIGAMISELERTDPQFAAQVKQISSLSRMYTAIKARQDGIIKTLDEIEKQIDDLGEKWQSFRNAEFLHFFKMGIARNSKGELVRGNAKLNPITKRTLGANFKSKNLTQAMKDGVEYAIAQMAYKEAGQAIQYVDGKISDKVFTELHKRLRDDLTQEILLRLAHKMQTSVSDLDKLTIENLIEKSVETDVKTKNYFDSNITKAAEGIARGLMLNGLMAEIKTGGRNTGQLTVKTVETKGKIATVSGRVDAVDIFDMEAKSTVDKSKIDKALNRNTDGPLEDMTQELKSALVKLSKEFDPSKYFQIHYSSKDYTRYGLEEDSKGKKTYQKKSSVLMQIASQANLFTRFAEIDKIAAASPASKDDLDKLKTYIINCATGFIAEGHQGNAAQMIKAIVAMWMFDDMEESFKERIEQIESKDNKVHIFFLSGTYVTLSDVLTIAYKNLNQESDFEQDGIFVNFSPTSVNQYQALRSDKEEYAKFKGIERWEETRDRIMKHSKFGVKVNLLRLENLIKMDLDPYSLKI